jgi:hypothetical protein
MGKEKETEKKILRVKKYLYKVYIYLIEGKIYGTVFLIFLFCGKKFFPKICYRELELSNDVIYFGIRK